MLIIPLFKIPQSKFYRYCMSAMGRIVAEFRIFYVRVAWFVSEFVYVIGYWVFIYFVLRLASRGILLTTCSILSCIGCMALSILLLFLIVLTQFLRFLEIRKKSACLALVCVGKYRVSRLALLLMGFSRVY